MDRSQHVRTHTRAGFSLLELTIAIAILAVVLGTTAQALVSYFGAINLQAQRNEAIYHCKTVLSMARDIRDKNPANFPGAVVTAFPNNQPVNSVNSLPSETIVVTYVNTTSNPLEIAVTSTWHDMRGRNATCRLGTILADR